MGWNGRSNMLTCKLTTPELQRRKATILRGLREQLLEYHELPSGFAYRFSGSDSMIDELAAFIKTERECCPFLKFSLIIDGECTSAWLELTGPDGAKEFIRTELQLSEAHIP